MRPQDLLRVAWRALGKHKLQSCLSTLGIVFAVVAVVAMSAVTEGAKTETLTEIQQLGTNNIIVRSVGLTEAQKAAARERRSGGLSLEDARSLRRRLPDIMCVAPLQEIEAAASLPTEDNPLEILAVTDAYKSAMDLDIRQGRFLTSLDVDKRNLVCVLGAEASMKLGGQGRLGQTIYLENRPFTVVGVLRARDSSRARASALNVRDYNRAIFIPLQTGPYLQDTGAATEFGELAEIVVRIKPGHDVCRQAAAVKRILDINHAGVDDYQMVVPAELLRQAKRTGRVFDIVLICIAGISLVVGGIAICNIMLASVSERTHEIGIRRAIGASRAHITMQFLSEAVLLTLIGGCAGVVMAVITVRIISLAAGWRTTITPWSLVLALMMATGVGLICGLYPAILAARMQPVTALRHE